MTAFYIFLSMFYQSLPVYGRHWLHQQCLSWCKIWAYHTFTSRIIHSDPYKDRYELSLLYVQLWNKGHCCYKSVSSFATTPSTVCSDLKLLWLHPGHSYRMERGVCSPSASPNSLRLLKHSEQVNKSARLSQTDIQAHASDCLRHACADNNDEYSSSNVSAAPRRLSDLFCLWDNRFPAPT